MPKKRGHGEGSIAKRKDGRWQALVTTGYDPKTGQQKRKAIYGKTRDEVQKKLNQLLYEMQTGTFVEPNRVTLGEWLDKWLETYQKPKVALSTYAMQETLTRVHIKPVLGRTLLSKLKPIDIQNFYTQRLNSGAVNGGGLSSQSVRHMHNILHAALKQATRENLVIRNVAGAVSAPRVIKLKEMEPLSREDVRRFLITARNDRLYAAFLLDLATGLRRGELLGLKWEDIDLNNSTIQVRRSLQRVRKDGVNRLEFTSLKTAKSKRFIPFPQEALKELKSHKTRQAREKLLLGQSYQENSLVFATADGKPLDPNNFFRRWASLLKKAGLKHTRFHNVRHTFASMLLEAGEHPKVVQELLGHSKVSMTLDTYSHVIPGLKERAATRLNDMFVETLEYEQDQSKLVK